MRFAPGVAGYAFWRNVWFYRNPGRTPPAAPGLVSPADGTVVYVKRVEPGAEGSISPEAEAADAPPTEDTGPRLLIQGEGKALESRTMGAAPVAAKTTKPEPSKKDTKAGKEKAAKAEPAAETDSSGAETLKSGAKKNKPKK